MMKKIKHSYIEICIASLKNIRIGLLSVSRQSVWQSSDRTELQMFPEAFTNIKTNFFSNLPTEG